LCSRLSTRFRIPSAFPRLGLNSQQVKTNPEPDKPLALKSRVVVEFTADEGFGDTQQVHQSCFSVIPAQKTPPISLKIILTDVTQRDIRLN
jgi:hypothetical protein